MNSTRLAERRSWSHEGEVGRHTAQAGHHLGGPEQGRPVHSFVARRRCRWFRNAQARPEAHIQAGGIERDVELVRADQSLNGQIDTAYRAKYTPVAPSYVDPMVSSQARATTLKLEPRT